MTSPLSTRCHRQRARHRRAIGTLAEHEACALVVHAGHVEQDLQRHAGEFAAAEHAMRVLAGRHGHIAPLHAGVGATFDEVEATHRGQAHQLVHREDHRPTQDLGVGSIDHQAVLGRVDVPPALVMPLEMQAARRDDAEQRLQRCKRYRRLGGLGQPGAEATLHIRLVLGGLAITVGDDGLAQAGAVLGQLENVPVAAGSADGVRSGRRQGCSGDGSRRGEGIADEVSPALLGLGKHLAHACGV